MPIHGSTGLFGSSDGAFTLYVVGWLLVGLAASMLLPAVVDAVGGHPEWQGFILSAMLTGFIGSLLILTCRRPFAEPQLRTAFLLTSLSWVAIIVFGSLPFQLATPELGVTDAIFESTSGLTTTGGTVIVGLDRLPPGVLLWRGLLNGIGGIGIVLMAIVLLPFLRVGGMQLFRTESSDRTAKLLPSARAVTTRILGVYLALIGCCTLALYLAGMSALDALCHALPAVATGGFSTRDASVGAFASPAIEWILIGFMILGALPFVRYVALLQGRPRLFWADSQVRLFLALIVAAVAALALWLVVSEGRTVASAVRAAAFNAVSVITTTGFVSEDYGSWGEPALALFLALTVVGGCTGSTSGGIKTFRFEILWQAASLYLTALFMPSRVARPRYEGRPLEPDVITGVLSFVFLFIGSWGLFTVLLGALGLDLVTAISASAASLANVGPGLGPIVGPAGTFAPLPDAAKWLLTLAMLLGRLEFFTILVLLHPGFWRR